ncbi:MAG: protease inhibitor I42 family protein [Candidatus Competibacter denitrificans]|jgi:inhibitor of cysteine peptidase
MAFAPEYPIRCLRFVPMAILAILAAVFTGCASKQGHEPVSVPPAGIRENGMLVVTHTDNNRTAELRVGERLAVKLPENPSTGYAWAIDESDGRLLALDSTAYDAPTEGSIGARGRRVFTFSARQAGDVVLKLKYWRFWDGDASVTERYQVTLKLVP